MLTRSVLIGSLLFVIVYALFHRHINFNSNPYSNHQLKPPNSDLAEIFAMGSKWVQKTISLPPQKRGCHLLTSQIVKEIQSELEGFKVGLAHFFLQHTSASLTINENYDTDVQHDTETFLNRIVPEGRSAPWRHVMEGPDDMPAHIKSSLFGCSLMIPIKDGHLNMGTWQGIWLCEHRDHANSRSIVVTMNGIPIHG